jgi:glyoxylase-like metal-dependent hydrolase (beta-lactamase superfamily II)
MRFGSLRLDVVPGGRFRRDAGSVFGVVPRALWQGRFPADSADRVGLASNCLLARGAGFSVLIDAGTGDKWTPEERERDAIEPGQTLVEGLAARGVRREEIDAVVLSNLRFDHAGGATVRERGRLAPAFPRARLYVQAAELARARTPPERDRCAYRPENWEPYADAGRLEALDGEASIRPGVTAVALEGHSGLQAVRIESEGKTAFYFGDALPTAAHLPIAWVMAADSYPAAFLADKKRLLDRAAAEGWLCVFEHDPDLPWGTIVDEVNGKRRVHVVRSDREEF